MIKAPSVKMDSLAAPVLLATVLLKYQCSADRTMLALAAESWDFISVRQQRRNSFVGAAQPMLKDALIDDIPNNHRIVPRV